jgi:hypothetical protein
MTRAYECKGPCPLASPCRNRTCIFAGSSRFLEVVFTCRHPHHLWRSTIIEYHFGHGEWRDQ